MEGGWLASYVVLWILTVALALLALSHSRLLGVLYQRVGPGVARPLSDGPEIGSKLDEIGAITLAGDSWVLKFPARRDLLAIFVSPQCQTCNELMPHVRDFVARNGERTDVALISVLRDLDMNQAYVRFAKLANVNYVIGNRLADQLEIAVTPYAVRITAEGVVAAKGVANNYEHLASFLAPALASPAEAELSERITEVRP